MQVPRHVLIKQSNTIAVNGFPDVNEYAYTSYIFIRSLDMDEHIYKPQLQVR